MKPWPSSLYSRSRRLLISNVRQEPGHWHAAIVTVPKGEVSRAAPKWSEILGTHYLWLQTFVLYVIEVFRCSGLFCSPRHVPISSQEICIAVGW
jgi:hypothetical protein